MWLYKPEYKRHAFVGIAPGGATWKSYVLAVAVCGSAVGSSALRTFPFVATIIWGARPRLSICPQSGSGVVFRICASANTKARNGLPYLGSVRWKYRGRKLQNRFSLVPLNSAVRPGCPSFGARVIEGVLAGVNSLRRPGNLFGAIAAGAKARPFRRLSALARKYITQRQLRWLSLAV